MLKQTQKTLYIISFFWTMLLSAQNICTNYTVNPGRIISASGAGAVYNTTINVPDSYTLTDVNITLDISHTWNDDLEIFLISPSGTSIEISTDNGGRSNNYDNVTFDDNSLNTLTGGNYTLTGDYQPEESLATLNGDDSNGDWILRVVDDANLDGGSINEIILNLCYAAPTPGSGGYLGPGGVGNTDGTSNLVLWTNPDNIIEAENAAFSSWNDLSGYSSDLTQGTTSLQPKIKKNLVNGYDVVRFETTNRRLRKTNFTNFPTTEISGFYVNKTSDPSNDGILSYASSTHNNNFLIYNSNNLRMYRNNYISSSLDANNNVWNIVGFRWKSSGGTTKMSLNGNSGYTGTLSNGTSITAGGTLALAGEQDSVDDNYASNQAHQGDFSEVILFNTYINETERIIVSNYLSAKYNITLSANNFYNEDDNGDFDHNVAGIGQASDGSNHTDSQGTGIIRINTPSALSNDEFLFWGEDVKGATYNFLSSSASDYIERLDTKWRVSKRNDLGTVNVSIKETDITLNSTDGCNSLKLIVSGSSTFATKNTYNLVLSGGIYTATGVDFSDNDYFTLEYIDTIVIDATTAYNGDGISNAPNISDDCYKLLVKSTADGMVSLTEDADVREIEIEAGGILAVNTGHRLKVTNGIDNNGDIRLVGTSQLVQTHTTGTNLNTGSGNLYVDQTASTSTVYQSGYWSSPVRKLGTAIGTDFAIKDVLKDGSVATAATPTAGEAVDIDFISGYDGDASSSPIKISERWLAKLIDAADWTRFVDPTAAIFKPAQGWNMKSAGARLTFKGIPNDGTYTSSISQNNYSLLGNPYPSALDSEAFITDNLSAIKGTLYLYNGSSDITHVRGDYTGTYSTIVSGVTIGGGRYLPIGQAFFVTREDAGTGTITFKNTQRPTDIDLDDTADILAKSNQNIKTKDKDIFPILRLGFQIEIDENYTYKREVAIAFRGLTKDYENGFDGEMFDKKPSDLGLKIGERDYPFVISSVEDFDVDLEIPLLLELDRNGNVKFTINKLENIEDIPVILNDRLTNNFYDLSKEDALLDLIEGTYSDRFFITFNDKVLSLEDALLKAGFTIFQDASAKELVVKNINNKNISNISIYSLTGKKIIELSDNEKLKNTEIKFKTSKVSTAVYIVNITTAEGITSKKILIQ